MRFFSCCIAACALIAGNARTAAAQDSDRLRVLWTSRGNPSEPLSVVSGMVEAPDGSVLISDERNQAVYRLDRRANQVSVIARSGNGPGEVRTPGPLARGPHGEVALYDLGHQAILLFDRESRFVRLIRLEKLVTNPKGFAALADSTFVMSGGMFGNAFSVHWFGRDGRLLGSAQRAPQSQDPITPLHIAGGPVWPLKDGSLLYSNSAPHAILKLAVDGSRSATTIASDPDLLPAVADDFMMVQEVDGRRAVFPRWFYAQSRGVFVAGDNEILNVVTRVYEGDSLWERWRMDGGFLGRLRVPRAYRPWSMTAEGNILATYSDSRTEEFVAVEIALSN